MRSKSELVISNVLYRMGVNYQYERQLEGEIERGKVRPYCSFTDPGDDLIIWEDLGMVGRADYRERWKKAWYEKNGYSLGQDLVTTEDDERGGLDSITVRETAEDIARKVMVHRGSRVAAIYDVHGNLPALETVLADFESVKPDLVVVGGDVVAGPMPTEVLTRLAALSESVCFVRGNADREIVAAYDHRRYADAVDVTDSAERVAAYAASKIDRAHRDLLASFVERLVVEVEGVGPVLFCHGSPRSDEEIVTAATTEGRLRALLRGVDQDLVVCGHTHAQFDRRVGAKRVINAGSVGMPYQGRPVGAFWLLLGVGGVSLRRSDYDLDRAVERIRATGYPDAEDMAEILLEPPDPVWVASFFERQAAGD